MHAPQSLWSAFAREQEQERQSEGEENMFEIIKTENKVNTDFSFVYSASIKKKHRTTERTKLRLCTLAQTHKIVMALECLCERVYRFFFLFPFIFVSQSFFFFSFSFWVFEKCSLRSFDNRNYVIAHLLVCISFARSHTHTASLSGRCLSFPLAVSVVHTKLLLGSKRGV